MVVSPCQVTILLEIPADTYLPMHTFASQSVNVAKDVYCSARLGFNVVHMAVVSLVNNASSQCDPLPTQLTSVILKKPYQQWQRIRSSVDLHMQKLLADLQAQNERLRRDNERFVRLIDSGEWGRGRVAELVTAGEVLQGERDALLKLIQSLRREYEAVQTAKGAQEDELRSLKERMVVGVSPGGLGIRP